MKTVEARCRAARDAQPTLAIADTTTKNRILNRIAQLLEERTAAICVENQKDLDAADKAGLSTALRDRLLLSPKRIAGIARGVREIALAPDPIGRMEGLSRRPNGLRVGRMRIPLGVVAMIFESRPNVVIDAGALCLKSANAVILKGGKEAACSNAILAEVLADAVASEGLPRELVVSLTDRGQVEALLEQDRFVDLVIPRGGEGLVRYVTKTSRIPVVQHYKGVCHVYVDQSADLNQAQAITLNAKIQRPGVCNAAETLLVHRSVAKALLPSLVQALQAHKVEVRGCPETQALAQGVVPATEADWGAEYLDLILSVRVVSDMDAAIAHIQAHGSNHTEAIITRDYSRANAFVARVPSSAVVVNASTRFNDGGQLGLGAEIGISTSRLHAFGPMGLEELTTRKWVVYGDGQTRT